MTAPNLARTAIVLGPAAVYKGTMSPGRRNDRLALLFALLAVGSLGAEVWALVRTLGLLLSR
ncbi:MAG: hypothetical protein ACRD16_16085 [Thermoanaerobaculia bacterium]